MPPGPGPAYAAPVSITTRTGVQNQLLLLKECLPAKAQLTQLLYQLQLFTGVQDQLLLLKVPKRENFSLAFFALNEPIWVCDLGTGEKNRIFYQLTPDFDGVWFFAAD